MSDGSNGTLAFNYSSSFKWIADPNPLPFRELGELGYIPGSEDRNKASHGFDDHRAH